MDFIIIYLLIIIHELGHILTANLLHIKLQKIYIYPLGGISKLNIPINFSQVKELIILLAGPIFQTIGSKYLITLFSNYQNIIKLYNTRILIFNLLPIYPLDGGKILNIIFTNKIPYKKSLHISIFISYLTTIVFFLANISPLKINTITITIFLLKKITEEKNKINIYYEKLLLEKNANNQKYKDTKIITKSTDFYRNKHHIVLENNKYYLENEYLAKKYNFF